MAIEIQKLHEIFLACGSVTTDSRKIEEGQLFIGLKGENFDGSDYAFKAIESGAAYAVVSDDWYKSHKKEIEAVQPKVIFAFGANARWWLGKFGVSKACRIIELPHPAKRSLPRKFFQTLYFCEIARALFQEGIISEAFYMGKMKQYANTPKDKE